MQTISIVSQNLLLSVLAIGLVLMPGQFYELHFQGQGQKEALLTGVQLFSIAIFLHWLGYSLYFGLSQIGMVGIRVLHAGGGTVSMCIKVPLTKSSKWWHHEN